MKRPLLVAALLAVTAPLWAQVGVSVGWTNATEYEDGTPLPPQDIIETRVLFSTAPGAPPMFVEVAPGPAQTLTTLPIFSAGTWYARIEHVAANGAVGLQSNEASFSVGRCQASPTGCRPKAPTSLSIMVVVP